MNISLHNILATTFKVVFLSVFAFVLVQCKNETDTTRAIPVIDIEKGLNKGGTVKLSELCSSLEYIPLQTDPNSIVGSRPKLQTSGDLFYVTYIYSDNCMVFDSDGLFRNTIGRKGNAKGEYTYINDLNIEEDRSNIALRDFKKIVIYNAEGLFIKEIPLDQINEGGYSIQNFVYMGEGKYWGTKFHGKNYSEVISVIDNSGNVLLSQNLGNRITQIEIEEIDGKKVPVTGSRPPYIYRFENSVRYLSTNNDTIFSFSEELVKNPTFIIDLGSYKSNLENTVGDASAVKVIESSFQESNDYIFFRVIAPLNLFPHIKAGTRFGYTLYDKTKGEVRTLSYDSALNITGLTNDIDNGMPFWPNLVTGNKMYQIIDALAFINMSENTNSAKMKEIASTFTENSNPVLVVATFK